MLNYVIMLSYVAAIILAVIGATISFLGSKRFGSPFVTAMLRFQIVLIAVCFYDLAIYMMNYIIGPINSAGAIKLGDCMIALLIAAWVQLADRYVGNNSYRIVNRTVQIYCFAYAAFWLVVSLITLQNGIPKSMNWVLIITDILLACMLIMGSMTYIGESVWSRQRASKVYYLLAITVLMSWNYISYFVGEASIFWDETRSNMNLLNLTIFFWLGIALVNLIAIYRNIMVFAMNEVQHAAENMSGAKKFEFDEALSAVSERFGLTSRENEILRHIYEGKSNAEIAEELFISDSTVKTHIYNIFRKLGVKNRIEAVYILRGDGE